MAEGTGLNAPVANFHYQRMDYPFTDCLPQLAPAIENGEYGLVIVDSLGLAWGGDPEVARFIIPFSLV